MYFRSLQICIEKKIQYIVAPFEADAELAYLSSSGHVDAVLTEDSDLLAYGCQKVPVSYSSINPQKEEILSAV